MMTNTATKNSELRHQAKEKLQFWTDKKLDENYTMQEFKRQVDYSIKIWTSIVKGVL